ncbi:ubiquitin-NEDD8-like protein RUB2 [Tanacetum coccineum]
MLFVHEEEANEKSSLDDYHIKMGYTLFFVTLIKPMQQLKFGRREFFVFKTISRDNSYLLIANSAKYHRTTAITGLKTTRLEVKCSDTIHNMKAKIHNKDVIPLDQLTLLLDGKQLDDSRTFADYGVNKRYAFYVVPDDNNRTIAD